MSARKKPKKEKCRECKGSGRYAGPGSNGDRETCPFCDGTGEHDAFRTFNPYSIHVVRGSMGHTLEIKFDPRDGCPVRVVDLGPAVDLSYGDAHRLAKILDDFLKEQPRHQWRTGEMLRSEIKRRKGTLAHKERGVEEEREWIARLEGELRRRGEP